MKIFSLCPIICVITYIFCDYLLNVSSKFCESRGEVCFQYCILSTWNVVDTQMFVEWVKNLFS